MTFVVWARTGTDGSPIYTSHLQVSMDGELLTNPTGSAATGYEYVLRFSAPLVGDEREYTLRILAWDDAGNSAMRTVKIVYQTVSEGDDIGEATIRIDATTVGLGIVDEETVRIKQGDTAAQTVLQMLEDCGYEAGYDGLAEKNGGFYLMRLTRGDLLFRAQVPERLWTLIQRDGISLTGAPGRDSLGQHDYTWGAGWMYDVNGYYPGKGLSEWMLGDGDVLTLRFTLAWGKISTASARRAAATACCPATAMSGATGRRSRLATTGRRRPVSSRRRRRTAMRTMSARSAPRRAATSCRRPERSTQRIPRIPRIPRSRQRIPRTRRRTETRGACSLKQMRNILILLLCAALLAGCGVRSAPAKALEGCRALLGVREGFLEGRAAELAGSSIGDWLAMALLACGANESYDAYLAALERHVTERYAEQGTLDALMATEYSRTILTVAMLGGDPAAFGTRPDGTTVDLLDDGVWNFAGELGAQGLNGLIFALLAVDAGTYPEPERAKNTRAGIVEAIRAAQEPDGGFGLVSGASEADLTARPCRPLRPTAGTRPWSGRLPG